MVPTLVENLILMYLFVITFLEIFIMIGTQATVSNGGGSQLSPENLKYLQRFIFSLLHSSMNQ